MPDPTHPLHASVVRIWAEGGRIVGTGFLVTDRHLLTCAHVVAEALGVAQDAPGPPDGAVSLDFPLLAARNMFSARVVAWLPVLAGSGSGAGDGEDVAVLELPAPPDGGRRPVGLVEAENLWGHAFRAFGFPAGYDNGVWATGELHDRIANGWVQVVDVKQTGYFVEPGFSGGPVWDDRERAVVGMVVGADRRPEKRAAYAIPVSQLLRAWPPLDRLTRPPCPYRGLFAFREEDAPIFFGREGSSEQLVQAVGQQTLVAVVGASGSGKSSLVFAGLIPRLRQVGSWLVASFRPGARPFDALAATLVPLLEPDMSETDRLVETAKLAGTLRQGSVGLGAVLERIRAKGSGTGQLLLVADQFEELYALCRDADAQRAFVDAFLAAFAEPPGSGHPNIVAILTMRADFLGHALSHRPMADALQGADVKLGPMTEEELRAAIERPAALRGVGLEPGLADRILEDVSEEPGCLPLLEFALAQLWEEQESGRLTHAAYEKIGGVERALARHADAVWGTLGGEEEQVHRVFVQLVRPGEGAIDTRRRATRTELGDEAWTLVTRLASERLVVTGRDEASGEETVEVVHEALIGGWNRLREWMVLDREFRMWQERLRAAMRQWEASDRDEGALLRGVPLAQAVEWLNRRGGDLGAAERAYVAASVDLRDRERAATEAARAAQERQRRRVTAGLSAFSVVALILAGVAGSQWIDARKQERRAEHVRLVAQADSAVDDQLDLGLLLSVEAVSHENAIEARNNLFAAVHATPRLAQFLHWHTENVNAVAFSPDGKTLASGDKNGKIVLWDPDTGQIRGTPEGDTGPINTDALAFSPDGRHLVAGSTTVTLWDVSDPTAPQSEKVGVETGKVTAVAFSSNGEIMASASCTQEDGGSCSTSEVHLWRTHSLESLNPSFTGATAGAAQIAFRPDSATLAIGGCGHQDDADQCVEGEIQLWDVAAWSPVGKPLVVDAGAVTTVAFSADGQTLASGHADGRVVLWDVDRGEQLRTLEGHTALVSSVDFSPDNATVASASHDKSVLLWDVTTGQQRESLKGHNGVVTSVAFNSDPLKPTLATASRDMAVIVWDLLPDPPRGALLAAHRSDVNDVAFSSDGTILASGGKDSAVVLWDSATGQRRGPPDAPPAGHADEVTAVAFSSDGTILASGGKDSAVVLWDSATGQRRGPPLTDFDHGINDLAFRPDSATLAIGGCGRQDDADQCVEGEIQLWDVAAWSPVSKPLVVDAGAVTTVAFSADGQTLASGHADGRVVLWDVDRGEQLRTLEGHDSGVTDVAFGKEDKSLASGSKDRTVRLWDVTTGEQLERLEGHPGFVTSVAFSGDGEVLASGSRDPGSQEHNVILWEAATGEALVHAPVLHTGWVNAVALSPDGATLVSAGQNGAIIFWHADIASLPEIACARAGRNLRRSEWVEYFDGEPYRLTCADRPLAADRTPAPS